MDNAEAGPGPATARIKFTVPSVNASWTTSGPDPLQPNGQSISQTAQTLDPSIQTSSATDLSYTPAEASHGLVGVNDVSQRPKSGKGSRGGRGARGARGPRGGRVPSRRQELRPGIRQQPTRNAGRQSLSRTQEMMLDSDGKPNRKVTISFTKGNNTVRLGGDGARKSSFLGDYDRDLDENPSEPLVFEEQFILRVPERIAASLRETVKGKSKGLEGVEIRFLDSRRAAFKYEGKTYASKLVDLPNIIESQKTFDSRHLFKVADISQMLVVDEPVEHENAINASALNIDDYVWPHGITPPLRHVRKRRFRKRLSRRAIEVVEESVEELIQRDEEAEDTYTDLIDVNVDPDVPDSYYIDYDPDAVWYPQEGNESEFDGSEAYEDPGSVAQQSDWEGESGIYGDQDTLGDYGEDDDEDEGEVYDDDLAAALREEMKEASDDEGVDEDGVISGEDEDEEGARSGDDEDEEASEVKAKIKQYNGEIKVLEATVERKRATFAGGNPIMVKRFEETIAGLQADIHTKIKARQALQDDLEKSKAATAKKAMTVEFAEDIHAQRPGIAVEDEDIEDTFAPEADGVLPPDANRAPSADEEDDLFGDGDEDEDDAVDTPGLGSTAQHEDHVGGLLDEHDGEDSESLDAEMAAMLNAELGAMDGSSADDTHRNTSESLPPHAPVSAMDVDMPSLEQQLETYQDESIDGGFGVEGGVGMRRLATGVLDDDDDGDSDSSSSSD